MKRTVIAILLLALLGISTACMAEDIEPYASEEIIASSVMLTANKNAVFSVTVKNPSYTVHTNYCYVYRDTGSGFTYLGALSRSALPADSQGNLVASADISSFVAVSGTYKVTASYTVGSSTRVRSATRKY